MINFRDDAAVAQSGKWQIRLLSWASFMLAPGHRQSLLSSPVNAFELLVILRILKKKKKLFP